MSTFVLTVLIKSLSWIIDADQATSYYYSLHDPGCHIFDINKPKYNLFNNKMLVVRNFHQQLMLFCYIFQRCIKPIYRNISIKQCWTFRCTEAIRGRFTETVDSATRNRFTVTIRDWFKETIRDWFTEATRIHWLDWQIVRKQLDIWFWANLEMFISKSTIFLQKSGSVTFLPLWSPNFI